MSLKSQTKRTIFPQSKVKRNFPENFSVLKKSLQSYEDSAVFFMLADATCSALPKVNIEKIHVDVFHNQKITKLVLSKNITETLEILADNELLKELKASKKEAKSGKVTSWKKVKKRV